MMQVNWPFHLQQNAARFKVVGQSLEPQIGISGSETVIPSMGARWEAEVDVQIRGGEAFLQFEAFVAGMEGHLGTTLVPVRHLLRPLDAQGRSIVQCNVASLSDGGTSEHWGFVNEAIPRASLANAVPLRATEVSVVHTNATGIRPGHFFQIGGSLCKAQTTWDEGEIRKVRFQPPLRHAAEAGTPVVLDSPVLKMRLKDPDSIQLNSLSRTTQYFNLRFKEVV